MKQRNIYVYAKRGPNVLLIQKQQDNLWHLYAVDDNDEHDLAAFTDETAPLPRRVTHNA